MSTLQLGTDAGVYLATRLKVALNCKRSDAIKHPLALIALLFHAGGIFGCLLEPRTFSTMLTPFPAPKRPLVVSHAL